MWKRGWIFAVVLVAAGLGVWVGVTTAGTGATPWIKATTGVVMMIFGGIMLLSSDAPDRRHAQFFGAGFLFLGVSQLVPSGPWSMAASLAALGCMITALVRRRRAPGLPHSAG